MRIRTLLPALLLGLLLPATGMAEGYGIQPGDVLEISVWREEDLAREVLVRPDGGISFPLVGDLQAQGRTVAELRQTIAERLQKYIPDPEVTVAVKQIAGNTVFVIGKVARPGAFIMSQPMDVMQALSMAGGTTTFAALNKIKVLRRADGRETAIPFRYAEVEAGENLEQNILLRPGDVVVVP
ncbi:MAG: polysaccharide export protein [Gammaproteobacteria bacterium]|nr:MAG: polysaccharide export protein [Gammaproteobacteria bacterium]